VAFLSVEAREMENISRGATFGDFVTIRTEASMQDVTVARPQSTGVYGLHLSFSFKCNVLRENLSVDGQNILCATLKRRWSWVIFVYLWLKLTWVGDILVPPPPPIDLYLGGIYRTQTTERPSASTYIFFFCLAPAD
jgi:hypothetical protein